MSARRRPAGFSLLELVLVMLVLGLLAGLAAPRLWGHTADARRARAAADLAEIAQALELYRLEAGSYPTTAQGLDALTAAATLPPRPRHWRPGGYLRRPPVDPWGRAYAYARRDGARYALRSFGADGTPGGSGEAEDLDARP